MTFCISCRHASLLLLFTTFLLSLWWSLFTEIRGYNPTPKARTTEFSNFSWIHRTLTLSRKKTHNLSNSKWSEPLCSGKGNQLMKLL